MNQPRVIDVDAHEPVPIITILFTSEDVLSIAEETGIDPDLAMGRALEWGKHIEGTMSGYCTEQLTDAIRSGQP
jgi:hypothetical protein